ncbi:hypothetical protein GJ496_005812 [Pomphorhynchus laevis]|nr:hypothetical protein GJ496_005812 [Pomphorhynchus laevis]
MKRLNKFKFSRSISLENLPDKEDAKRFRRARAAHKYKIMEDIGLPVGDLKDYLFWTEQTEYDGSWHKASCMLLRGWSFQRNLRCHVNKTYKINEKSVSAELMFERIHTSECDCALIIGESRIDSGRVIQYRLKKASVHVVCFKFYKIQPLDESKTYMACIYRDETDPDNFKTPDGSENGIEEESESIKDNKFCPYITIALLKLITVANAAPDTDVSDNSSLSSNSQEAVDVKKLEPWNGLFHIGKHSVVGPDDSIDKMDWRIMEMSKATRFVKELFKYKLTSPGGVFLGEEDEIQYHIRCSLTKRAHPRNTTFLICQNYALTSGFKLADLTIKFNNFRTLHLLEETAITHVLTGGVPDTKRVQNALTSEWQVSPELAGRLSGLLRSSKNVYDNTSVYTIGWILYWQIDMARRLRRDPIWRAREWTQDAIVFRDIRNRQAEDAYLNFAQDLTDSRIVLQSNRWDDEAIVCMALIASGLPRFDQAADYVRTIIIGRIVTPVIRFAVYGVGDRVLPAPRVPAALDISTETAMFADELFFKYCNQFFGTLVKWSALFCDDGISFTVIERLNSV